jgi:hypothetical protein
MKIEAICSSITFENFYMSIQPYIPEDQSSLSFFLYAEIGRFEDVSKFRN